MTTTTAAALELPAFINGQPVESSDRLEVLNPWDGSLAGTVPMLGPDHLEAAIQAGLNAGEPLTRYQRHEVLTRASELLGERTEEYVELLCREAGLCVFETRYEVGRTQDVLRFAAMECLKDDGQIFSCDISPSGPQRKIFTVRDPLPLMAAITPFNHPLNQVAHKIAPAIAAGTAAILKPSEKTPLVATKFTELLYEAGLPDSRVELVSFTGSAAIGKTIAKTAGYKKLCLELGGNSPLIILADCDMELAVNLAAEGCYRNSGQRCTAVKRLLVHEDVEEEFTERLVAKTANYPAGDPADPATRIGTVIDEAAAIRLEEAYTDAVSRGAKILAGGERSGAQIPPTVITDVPRDAPMVVEESFGPLAPILRIKDLDDAIELANSTAYGLSSGVVTEDIGSAMRCVRELRTGTVNVNQVPGFRIECSPFGGVKDSGLGIKEGVIEAMKTMSTVKTFSLPWG